MKHSIIEIVACLFGNIQKQNFLLANNRDEIIKQLLESGFTKSKIDTAFNWLTSLMKQENSFHQLPTISTSLRIFTDEENIKLSLTCKKFILLLEQLGILNTQLREIVISELCRLNQRDIDIIDTKWVVLLVLLSQSTDDTVTRLHKFMLATTAHNI